jgi:hypothetical protein
MAPLQLHVDIAPGSIDAIAAANEAVVENYGEYDQRSRK